MAQNEISAAARALCEEKGISLDDVVETIESALAAAYRKDYGEKNQNIKAKFDLDSGEAKFYDEKTVVEDLPEEELAELKNKDGETGEEKNKQDDNTDAAEKSGDATEDHEDKIKEYEGNEESKKVKDKSQKEDNDSQEKTENRNELASTEAVEKEEEKRRFNPRTDIQLKDAKDIKKSYKIGDVIITDLKIPEGYGRMAAQTAKQVIIQRIREIERNNLYNEFKDKEHEVVAGVVQRREGRIVLVDLGKSTGVIPPEGQVSGENYLPGQRVKVYVEAVNITAKGPEIILSRASDEIVRKIFYVEIPEIANGLIEIKAIAREAGSRSKIAVIANEENVDPIGSCVGQRGARIQTIIEELGGEKVDIIQYSEDPAVFIANALAPAKNVTVTINEAKHMAIAKISDDQLSLAIGKGGQNVRLAARLTSWKIDIKDHGNDSEDDLENEKKIEKAKNLADEPNKKADSKNKKIKTKNKKDDNHDKENSENEMDEKKRK